MSRSRSRSRDGERDRDRRSSRRSRDRSRSKDRKRHKHRRRSYSRESGASTSNAAKESSLGSLFRKRDRKNKSPSVQAATANSSAPVPDGIAAELSNPSFNAAQLSEAAMSWLEERIAEKLITRVTQLEAAYNQKAMEARKEIEKAVRAQLEEQMRDEMERIKRDETESKRRCLEREYEFEQKLKAADEQEQKYNAERLAMLEQKSQLERERAELKRERDDAAKRDQQAILNRGGGSRAPIKMKLGFGAGKAT